MVCVVALNGAQATYIIHWFTCSYYWYSFMASQFVMNAILNAGPASTPDKETVLCVKSATYMTLEQAIASDNASLLDAAVKMAVSEGNDNALAEALAFAAKTDAIAVVTKITGAHGMLLAGDCETAAAFAVSEGMVDALRLEALSLTKNPLDVLRDYLTKRYRTKDPSEASNKFVTALIKDIFDNSAPSAIPTTMTILIPTNFTVADADVKKHVLIKNSYEEIETVIDQEFIRSGSFENAASTKDNQSFTRVQKVNKNGKYIKE